MDKIRTSDKLSIPYLKIFQLGPYKRTNVQTFRDMSLLAPTGALIVIVLLYISIYLATFSDFHSVH